MPARPPHAPAAAALAAELVPELAGVDALPEGQLRDDVLVCEECDLLHCHPRLSAEPTDEIAPSGRHFECRRCGGPLGLARHHGFDLPLALALTGLTALAIAHLNPVLAIEIQGQARSTTLWEAAVALYDDGAWFMSVLVLLTTLVAPLVQMAAVAYVLLPLRRGRAAPGFGRVLRAMHAVRPWVMVEVYMLGVLVALVKLAGLALVIPGVGLWAFGAVMLLLAATGSAFDHDHVWASTAALRRQLDGQTEPPPGGCEA
jgi:paraquat-inducible protein A